MRKLLLAILLLIFAGVIFFYWQDYKDGLSRKTTGKDSIKPEGQGVAGLLVEMGNPLYPERIWLDKKDDISAFWNAAFSESPLMDKEWHGWKWEHSIGFRGKGSIHFNNVIVTAYDHDGKDISWMRLCREFSPLKSFNYIQISGESRYFPIDKDNSVILSELLLNRPRIYLARIELPPGTSVKKILATASSLGIETTAIIGRDNEANKDSILIVSSRKISDEKIRTLEQTLRQ